MIKREYVPLLLALFCSVLIILTRYLDPHFDDYARLLITYLNAVALALSVLGFALGIKLLIRKEFKLHIIASMVVLILAIVICYAGIGIHYTQYSIRP